jgi:dTDP-4-dehydrorhamnose reductase
MLIEAGRFGTYHLVARGYCSRYEFAREILACAATDGAAAMPIDEYPQAAARPRFSALANVRAAQLGVELRPWDEALEDFLARARRIHEFIPEGFKWC